MSLLNKASLIQIPSGYKDGTLYSAKPTNGDGDFTFSRGSNLAATRVNSEGLIEKGRENVLLQSNTFDTTWNANYLVITSGQSGYDGTNNAWQLQGFSGTAEKRLRQSTSTTGIVTLSVYAKAGTIDFVWLRGVTNSANRRTFFNLSNGTIGSDGAIASKMTDVGNGWYRCEATFNQQSGFEHYIGITDANGSATTSSTGYIYIQDAQLEVGLVATDYIETTTTTEQAGILEDMPRLDYSGGASCPSLLLEPQRTNSLLHSEYLNGIVSFGGTVTDNSTTSPEGLVNAGLYTENTDNTYHRLNTGGQSYTQNQSYTFSVFAKSYSDNRFLIVNCSSAFAARSYFDLSDGTKNVVSGTGDIQDYGNGWYRCIVTGTRTAATNTDSIYFGLNTTEADTAYTGDGTSGMYFYGAQLEAASYPTSYIPTYGGSSVTRGLDNPTLGDLEVNGIFGATAGTLMVEYTSNEPNYIFDLEKTTGQKIRFFYNASSELLQIRDTTQSAWYYTYLDLPLDQNSKVLLRWSGTTLTAFINGTKAASDFTLNAAISIADFSGIKTDKTKQMLCFPTALTDAECIELTTI